MANQQIVIQITQNGGQVVTKQIQDIGTASKQSGSAVTLLKTALGSLGAVATIKGFVDMLDELGDARNRLGFVSKSTDEVSFSMQKLFQIANETRTSFATTLDLYSRISIATDQMGISHQTAARLVQTLNEAVILSGVSGRQAAGAMLYLSEGLASGTLRGRELRSLMMQFPVIAEVIATKLGVTRGALREMGTQGLISAQTMVQALNEAAGDIDAKFAKTVPTIGQQLTVLKNQVLQFVLELNERFGIISNVTTLIDFFGAHMETVGRVVLAGIFTAGAFAAVSAITLLTTAIAANPIGLLVVGVTAAVALLIEFADQINFSGDGVVKLSDFFKALWTELKSDIVFVGQLLQQTFGPSLTALFQSVFGTGFTLTLKGMVTAAATTVDTIVGFFRGAANVIKTALTDIPGSLAVLMAKAINLIITDIQIAANKVIEFLNNNIVNSTLGQKMGLQMLNTAQLSLIQLPAEYRAVGDDLATAWAKGFTDSHAAKDMMGRVIFTAQQNADARIKEQQDKQNAMNKGQNDFGSANPTDPNKKDLGQQATADIITKLKEQAEAMEQVSIQRRIDLDLLKIVNQERAKGIQLTDAEKQSIRDQLQNNEILKLKAKITQEITGAMQDNALEQKAVNEVIAQGTDHLSAYVAKLNELKIKQLEMNRDLTSGFKAGFLEMQNTMSDFAKQGEKVVGDMFNGLEDAVVEFAKTGKLNFSSLVDSILADLMKIVMNQAILAIIGALGGAAGGGGGGLGGILAGLASGFGGHRADGGSVSSGKAYLVGERGPEIFQPGTSGTIVPNHMVGGAQPQVNLHVVNVTDPNDVAAALGDPSNHQIVVNVIRRNKGAVKQALGI